MDTLTNFGYLIVTVHLCIILEMDYLCCVIYDCMSFLKDNKIYLSAAGLNTEFFPIHTTFEWVISNDMLKKNESFNTLIFVKESYINCCLQYITYTFETGLA